MEPESSRIRRFSHDSVSLLRTLDRFGISAHNKRPHRAPGDEECRVNVWVRLGLSEHRSNAAAARSPHVARRRARVLASQVIEDLIDDILLRDERDDPHRSGTVGTFERVDLEYFSEKLSPATLFLPVIEILTCRELNCLWLYT